MEGRHDLVVVRGKLIVRRDRPAPVPVGDEVDRPGLIDLCGQSPGVARWRALPGGALRGDAGAERERARAGGGEGAARAGAGSVPAGEGPDRDAGRRGRGGADAAGVVRQAADRALGRGGHARVDLGGGAAECPAAFRLSRALPSGPASSGPYGMGRRDEECARGGFGRSGAQSGRSITEFLGFQPPPSTGVVRSRRDEDALLASTRGGG